MIPQPPAAPGRSEPPSPQADITASITRVREHLARAAERAGRRPDEIQLVGVTKFVAADRVLPALRAGITAFGENYVQEAREKIPLVADAAAATALSRPEWHLIGRLQTNKAKYCPPLFDLVHSLDSFPLAEELGRAALKHGKTAQRVLIEVNLSGDTDRAGVAPDQALALCERVAQVPGLQLEGLMGIAPEGAGPEEARPFFQRLRMLWERLPDAERRILSMGMSADFETAIEEGATLVRVGTAIFGARRPPRSRKI